MRKDIVNAAYRQNYIDGAFARVTLTGPGIFILRDDVTNVVASFFKEYASRFVENSVQFSRQANKLFMCKVSLDGIEKTAFVAYKNISPLGGDAVVIA